MSTLNAPRQFLDWLALRIQGTPEQLNALLDDLDVHLPPGWRRDFAAEKRLRDAGIPQNGRCYSCEETPAYPATVLWLGYRGPDTLAGGQVVPLQNNRSYDEAANAVADFFERALEPAVRRARLEIRREPRSGWMDRDLPYDVREPLSAFSNQAEKAWPLQRREDRTRWRTFLIVAHRSPRPVGNDDLRDWLERNGWPKDAAERLVEDYGASLALLSQYDDMRQTA